MCGFLGGGNDQPSEKKEKVVKDPEPKASPYKSAEDEMRNKQRKSGNLITAFISLEIFSISLYILCGFSAKRGKGKGLDKPKAKSSRVPKIKPERRK